MPYSIKAFWLLSVSVSVFWILNVVWFVAFPSSHYISLIASLPEELREGTRRLDIVLKIVPALFWGCVTLILAWLAAFRRHSWARWVFIVVFVVRECIPLAVSLANHQLDFYIAELAHKDWLNPLKYVTPVLTVMAILFVFSRDAREWFARNTVT